MKKVLVFVLLLFAFTSIAYSETNYVAKILTDEKGNYLDGENINLKHPLASITKLMTVLVAMKEIEKSDEIKYSDLVTISANAGGTRGSSVGLNKGNKMSVEDLLKSVMVQSGNDAAVALAEYIAEKVKGKDYFKEDIQKEDEFVKLMNKKAEELSMLNTKYYTSTGLPTSMTAKELDVSTASDIAKLSIEALKYPKLINYASLKEIKVKRYYLARKKRRGYYETSKKYRYKNRNKLVNNEIDGLKTGHHDEALYNITISTKKNDLRFIVVVLGSPNEKSRDSEVKKIINYANESFERRKLASKGEFVLKTPIYEGIEKRVELVLKEDIYAVVSKVNNWKIDKTAYIPKKIYAPLRKNEKIGTLVFKYRDRLLGEVDLINKEEMNKITFWKKLIRKISFNLL